MVSLNVGTNGVFLGGSGGSTDTEVFGTKSAALEVQRPLLLVRIVLFLTVVSNLDVRAHGNATVLTRRTACDLRGQVLTSNSIFRSGPVGNLPSGKVEQVQSQ